MFRTLRTLRPRRIRPHISNPTTSLRAAAQQVRTMRVPYVSDPPPNMSPEEQAIYDRVAARRHPRPLQPLDLALMHNPHVADGWNSFLGAIRTKTSLPDDLREIAICRVAVLNGAAYEWGHHAPLAVKGGVSEEGMKTLARKEMSGQERGEGLTERQWVVCRVTDEMTKNVRVGEETFEEARKHFSEKEVMELVSTVAAYNCVSRFLVALDVGESNGKEITA